MSLPSPTVMSTVVLLCLIGTFAASYSMFDIGVMFVSGGVGYLLYRASYPFAPLILGLILGPLADQTLRRTIWIYDGKYHELLYRPVGLVLLVAVVWSFYYGIRRSREEGAKHRAEANHVQGTAGGQRAEGVSAAPLMGARHGRLPSAPRVGYVARSATGSPKPCSNTLRLSSFPGLSLPFRRRAMPAWPG